MRHALQIEDERYREDPDDAVGQEVEARAEIPQYYRVVALRRMYSLCPIPEDIEGPSIGGRAAREDGGDYHAQRGRNDNTHQSLDDAMEALVD